MTGPNDDTLVSMEAKTTACTFRRATPADAFLIAQQRASMFQEIDRILPAEAELLLQSSMPWMERLLAEGDYVGWFAVCQEQIAAGGGIHLRDLGPIPGCPGGGRSGHIANLYTHPAFRRRGVARRLMELILAWARAEQLNRVTLTASDQGRPLYESLGFTGTADMQLRERT